MSSSSGSGGSAVVAHTTFDSLRIGRSLQFVVARVLRFWDSKNIKKNGEFMGITVLLLDERDSVIHAFIPANRAAHYRDSLVTGSVVKVDRFEVARCAQTYKITEHQFVIRFIPSTSIVEVRNGAPAIKFQKFMVRQFDNFQMLANTNLELPDVVGQICSVQGADLKNEAATTRVVIRLLIEPTVTVYLSLWDEAAAAFRGLLSAGDKSQSVMLVTTVNPKLFGGNLYLNSTPGSKFFFDQELTEIQEFKRSMGSSSSGVYPCVDTLEGLKKKEVVSIGDLNTFISKSNEQTQEADFLCKARIVGVLQQNGWSFVSCTGCNRKLEKCGTSLQCSKCVTPHITGVIRFRVELAVDDGTDNATFVVFDKEMSRLTNQEASVLALEEGANDGEGELPACLEELAGKEFVFQIRVTPYNFTPNHRTFTVSTISEDVVVENQPEEAVENAEEAEENVEEAAGDVLPAIAEGGGLPTSSLDDRAGGSSGENHLSGGDKNRKRPRE